MNINLKSENFKNNIYRLINQSQLPVSNIYFIFKIMFQELEDLYYQTINEELEKENKKADETTTEEENNEQMDA